MNKKLEQVYLCDKCVTELFPAGLIHNGYPKFSDCRCPRCRGSKPSYWIVPTQSNPTNKRRAKV